MSSSRIASPMIFLLTWCLMVTVNVESLKFNNLNDSTSMIFVNTHEISIPNAYKTIEIKLEMAQFLHESSVLRAIVKNIAKLCQTISCNYFHRFVLQNIEQYENNQRKLIDTKRTKRATSIFASIYDYIFGGYVEIDQETLNELQSIHVSNNNVTAEHIRINSDTIQIHKGILNEFAANMKMLNDRLQLVDGDVKQLNNDSAINNLIHMLIITIGKRNELVNIILDILNGKTLQIIDIIGYESIAEYFQEMNTTLHENEHLLAGSVTEVIASADITAKFIENAIFIDIKIPIGIIDEYSSYEIIPIPFIQKNALYRAKTTNHQIVYSKKTKKIRTISEMNLNHCKKLTSRNRLICAADKFSSHQLPCEVAIFSNQNANACEFEQIPAMSQVIRISLDTFYCVTRKADKFTITCDGVTTTHEIKRNAWFQLDAGCMLNFANELFHVPYVANSKNIEIIIPKYGMAGIEKVLNEKNDDEAGLLSIVIDTDMMNAQFFNLTTRLSYLYERSNEQISNSHIAQRWNHGRSIWLFVIVVCLLVIGCRVLFKCLFIWRLLTGCKR